jgi:hypothetical protein
MHFSLQERLGCEYEASLFCICKKYSPLALFHQQKVPLVPSLASGTLFLPHREKLIMIYKKHRAGIYECNKFVFYFTSR